MKHKKIDKKKLNVMFSAIVNIDQQKHVMKVSENIILPNLNSTDFFKFIF